MEFVASRFQMLLKFYWFQVRGLAAFCFIWYSGHISVKRSLYHQPINKPWTQRLSKWCFIVSCWMGVLVILMSTSLLTNFFLNTSEGTSSMLGAIEISYFLFYLLLLKSSLASQSNSAICLTPVLTLNSNFSWTRWNVIGC
jgi:hypothetical protein